MNPERWEQVQQAFHEIADLGEPARRERLDALRATDPALAAEVSALLEEDARGDTILSRNLAEVAGQVLHRPAAPLPPQLGPYRLHELLGEGGMGVVFRAERADLRSVVAIKVLRDAWLSPARRERFAAEQRTLARLNHPCIARLYDADALADGTPWFAMEFVDGMPITRYCEARACNVRQRLELFRQVCEAVLHAHRHAVIHRDLKPSNLLVTHGGQPKLLDFGIARPLDRAAAGDDRTRTGLRLMTPAYAAPEQLRGEGLGVHTDVYSLGAVLYELLTGAPPFDVDGLAAHEVDEAIAFRNPEKPSLRVRRSGAGRRGVSPADRGAEWGDLDVLCLTAMQKDPARRYRTVDSLIRDLDHYLRGEPLEARPDSPAYRAGKFVRRHWRPLALTAVALVTVVGLVAYYTVRLSAARNAALAEAERTRRIQAFMNGLFEGGEGEAGPSDTLRVVTLLGRGVREAHALTGEPGVQAELYQTLGGLYQSRGELERADSLLSEALAIRRARLGETSPAVALNLATLGVVRADQSRMAEAESLARSAARIGRLAARSDPATHARTQTALGRVLVAAGKYDEAIRVLHRAVVLDSLARLPAADHTQTLTDLANAYFYAGHYVAADSLNQRILASDRLQYGDRHPHIASDLINLGAVQQELGEWARAEQYYRQALEIFRGWYGESHFETAASLNMVGRALIQQGRLREARAPLEQALAVRERVFGAGHPSVASTLNEMGLLAQREGRLADAEAAFRRMADIYREAYQDRHYLIGLAVSNLAGVRLDLGHHRDAERLYHEAIRRYAETLPADHLYHGIARLKLGRSLLRASRFEDALKETLAGFAMVTAQEDPAPHWLSIARTDLIAEYEGLGRTADASRVRAEVERDARPAAGP